MTDKTITIIIAALVVLAIVAVVLGIIDVNYSAPDLIEESVKCGALGYDKAFIKNDSGFGNWSIYCGHLMENKDGIQ